MMCGLFFGFVLAWFLHVFPDLLTSKRTIVELHAGTFHKRKAKMFEKGLIFILTL